MPTRQKEPNLLLSGAKRGKVTHHTRSLCHLWIFAMTMSISFFSLLQTPARAELKNGMEADVVLGQPDFNSGTADNGGVSARSLDGPIDISSDGTRPFLTDRDNNRVLIWNSFPTSNNASADVVIGQADFFEQYCWNECNQNANFQRGLF